MLPVTLAICSTACRGEMPKYESSMYGEIAIFIESKLVNANGAPIGRPSFGIKSSCPQVEMLCRSLFGSSYVERVIGSIRRDGASVNVLLV